MKYTNNACAVCFAPLSRPQNTCGAAECLDTWRHYSRDTRIKRKNLASYSPSQRALILAQGPTESELDQQAAIREELEAAVEERKNTANNTMNDSRGFMPKSLRDALLDNAPIIKTEGGDTE